MVTLGMIAWNTYKVAVGGTTFDGKPLPSWDELGERQRIGWEEAANAIRKELALTER